MSFLGFSLSRSGHLHSCPDPMMTWPLLPLIGDLRNGTRGLTSLGFDSSSSSGMFALSEHSLTMKQIQRK